jgi:hypothetical protein
MAKPTKDFHITKLMSNSFEVYSVKDSLELMYIIKGIEGVECVIKYMGRSGMMVRTNPLYDIDDIMNEVEALLTPIPDIFLNGDDDE